MNKEYLINEIMKACEKDGEPVTREEAEEMAEMEIKSNSIKRYEKSNKPRKKTTRERKVDPVKQKFVTNCKILLEDMGAAVTEIKTETEIIFTFQEEIYSLKLIKHRKKK